MGIQLNDTCIYTLQFADDQVVLAEDKEDLEYMTRKLKEEYEKWGLTMNLQKTQYLCVGADQQENLMLEHGDEITVCNDYKYLGVIFDKSGTDDKEIRSRIIQARKAINCLNGILWSKEITKQRKYNIYNTMIKSSLLYGSEVWRITENNKKKIISTEMDALRRSARISRRERKTNEYVKEQMGVEGNVMEDVERRQLIWYGHVQRMDERRLPKQAMQWTPRERRTRGRPRKNWQEGIRKAMSDRNLQDGQWNNRRIWNLGIGQRRQTDSYIPGVPF